MKILGIHSAYHPDQNKRSAVDAWRIARPLAELRKHTDWQIDERLTVIPHIEEYKSPKEFTEAEMTAAFEDICSYDIVISCYQSNPTIYSLLQVAQARANTQYILDVDDDMFAINPDNPVWLAVKDDNIFHMQRMIADTTWLSTTTKELANVFIKRRPGHVKESVFVTPNYISDAYTHPIFDNRPDVVIGFFGGSSHYGDLHRTGVLEAIQRLMHEYRNLHFKSVGIPIDTYLPRARYSEGDAKKGDAWLDEIYPNLKLDIAIAPLENNIFNKGKSNIKWQEASRAGAAFVCSDIGPYSRLNYFDAVKVPNNTEQAWYEALKGLIDDPERRAELVKSSQAKVDTYYRLETHWQTMRDMFQTVYDTAHGNITTKELTSAAKL